MPCCRRRAVSFWQHLKHIAELEPGSVWKVTRIRRQRTEHSHQLSAAATALAPRRCLVGGAHRQATGSCWGGAWERQQSKLIAVAVILRASVGWEGRLQVAN